MSHADDLQAVSVDEALIDVTSSVEAARAVADKDKDHANEYAELIRAQVKKVTGCTGVFAHICPKISALISEYRQ